MEDWLSQLEMEWTNEDMILNNNDVYMQFENHEQGMESLNEELALILGDDFPSPLSVETNISSPILPCNIPKVPSNLSISNEPIYHIANNNNNNNNNNNSNDNDNDNNDKNNNIATKLPQEGPNVLDGSNGKDQSKEKDGNNGKRKRKREPSQIHDHIMAERKRRELLGQLFIALSAILPGLKKVDKTSILGEAIKHLQQLKEKVKALEEAVATQNVKSMVIVKRSQLVVDNDDNNDDGNDNDKDKDDSSCTVEDHCRRDGGSGGGYPDIEVKVSNKTLLLTICCENRKGISAKIFGEVERHGIIILNSCIAPFGVSAFNVTIVAQTEKTDEKHVKNLVKGLHSILRTP
ncbi:hypothetical protein RND81_04G085500 [Saponaria officinalis]|uniref:Uncharacterized protein n=1 Tax=Saponaria officinalis TaxID=3572 RepID=A0AAW1LDP2_SAPOF